MNYVNVWLRGVRGIFSWHTQAEVFPGSRVRVRLRGRKKIGLVTAVSKKAPDFVTHEVEEILDLHFIPEAYLELAHTLAQEHFCRLEKVLSLIVPEKFFTHLHPEKRAVYYCLKDESIPVRGKCQQEVVALLGEKGTKLSEQQLREKVSLPTLQSLEKKGVLVREEGLLQTLVKLPSPKPKDVTLTSAQASAIQSIASSAKPTLLFGVTGSGKTEIYKALAQKTKGQTLLLVPEIALTPQLIAEFRSLFQEEALAVWHSKLSEGEKVQEWAKCQSGQARILIGARSAIMVPLSAPALIILDEEHEWTYKNEFAPRFWTHEVAEHLAGLTGGKLVLGTATPRTESFYKVENDLWNQVSLPDRVTEVKPPHITLVDLANEVKKGHYGPISEPLEKALKKTFSEGKQAVIFLNKRGFSGATQCRACGHRFECPHCSNPMKMHEKPSSKPMRKFICHVCGHLEAFPKTCPECSVQDFIFRGWGTQQVEKALKELFPGIRLLRADSDSITRKHDLEELLEAFHRGEADVLLGTQMIAKGLDFDEVELVGVVLADVGLNLPDFRAEERVFQLLMQVAGRAGRRQRQGHMVVQTFRPQEKIFDFLKRHDTEGFLQWQNDHRRPGILAPYGTMAKLTFSDVRKDQAFRMAQYWHKKWQEKLLKSDLQTFFAPAFFPRSHGKYHFHVFLKAKDRRKIVDFLGSQPLPDGIKVDIDPVSVL